MTSVLPAFMKFQRNATFFQKNLDLGFIEISIFGDFFFYQFTHTCAVQCLIVTCYCDTPH